MSDPLPEGREIPFAWALVPIVTVIVALVWVLVVLPGGLDWSAIIAAATEAGVSPDALPTMPARFEGTGHLPLAFAAAVAALVARRFGWRWSTIQAGMVDTIRLSLGAVLILLTIPILIATWMAAGIVPALVTWGLALLQPEFFLPASCAVCSIISIATGSSWSTAGTVGVALIGVSSAMGIEPAMTAGAIISGAYLGDKLSPMSDTTNLAPAMAGSDLFNHIRHMAFTTGPSWVIAMAGFAGLGWTMDPGASPDSIAEIQRLIAAQYEPGPAHLAVPVLVVVLVARKMPALPTLLLGAALGGVMASIVQGYSAGEVLTFAMDGFASTTGHAAMDELLSRGGLRSMTDTVFLVIIAMAFGGVLERTGMLRVVAVQLLARARSTGSLIASTVLTAIGANILSADQYIAIVVPGRMYADEYRRRGLAPENLSRALEDGGTITSPLVPWSSCGAFMASTLGVATGSYWVFCFLNLVNPLISILYGFTGWTIRHVEKPNPPRTQA
ncbi:MAG: Na+/H+ antiporter NhaC [Myxococcales bacterium FL481]|nr:MAG: Na+/H+ antiporter NhaC [Myxococcales bacterium FL481]